MDTPGFRRSMETQAIVDRLLLLTEGDFVSYDELSTLAGARVTGGSPALQSARRIVESEQQVALSVDRGNGVRRLTDQQTVEETHGRRDHLSRHARKSLARLATVRDYAGLSDDAKRAHQANAVIYAEIAHKASADSAKHLAATTSIDGRNLLDQIMKDAK